MNSYHLDHLQYLETEAIHVLREVAAEFERPALLFFGGKDSICLVRLAEKAFRPSDIPMPLLNVDTGHHFPELNAFRDRRAQQLGAKLIVRKVEDAIAKGIAAPAPGEASPTPPPCSPPAPRRGRCSVWFVGGGAPAATRKRPAPRSVSSAFATASASGT